MTTKLVQNAKNDILTILGLQQVVGPVQTPVQALTKQLNTCHKITPVLKNLTFENYHKLL